VIEILFYINMYCSSPSLAMAITDVESNFQNVKSTEGSIGLMQVQPNTAKMLNCEAKTVSDLMVKEMNIKCGCKYLDILATKYSIKDDIIASYNAGAPKICKTGILNPSNKKCTIGKYINQDYVDKVNQRLHLLKNFKNKLPFEPTYI
jgi:soluble lytic murein transglycosylase-like protein